MFEHKPVTHRIQKQILNSLTYQSSLRFSQLRPPKVDSNLYSYHLKLLTKAGLVEKLDNLYRLSVIGANYVDRVSLFEFDIRQQSKIITMHVIQNDEGDILLQKRTKQPYIDCWTLPYGKVNIDDSSVLVAAKRELDEKLGLIETPERAGDCYIRVWHGDQILSSTLVHVFRTYCNNVTTTDYLNWFRPHKLDQLDLAPAVDKIMTRTFFKDSHYFEEFNVDW